jgi:hypothetical protein
VLATTTHAAADASSVRHSLLPSWGSAAPSFRKGRNVVGKTRARHAARSRTCGCRFNFVSDAVVEDERAAYDVVVPAKAGTHNPRPLCWARGWSFFLFYTRWHGVWAPAFAGTTVRDGTLSPHGRSALAGESCERGVPQALPLLYPAQRAISTFSSSGEHPI